MKNFGIIGYAGRMGQAIARVLPEFPAATLVGGLVRRERSDLGAQTPTLMITSDADRLFPACSVLIDFSSADALPATLALALKHNKPLVVGITGLTPGMVQRLQESAQRIPLLFASNTSLSLAVMKRLVRQAAQLLREQDYDIAILDQHHRFKKDAPSGTAKTLGEAVLAGNQGSREPSYAAIRAGHIVGDHEVLFAGHGETISLRHSVTDRDIFARGAVSAALWLADKSAGFYSMDDVLNFREC
jgi:4-hydroxy-tetrahydrodipicolinate reductase